MDLLLWPITFPDFMYLPTQFREDEPERIVELIDAHGFATLVTVQDGAPFASHLALLYDPAEGPHGTIYGHLARSNPQARALAAGTPILAIFHGPHAYVSPSWYGTAGVPTWNYAVVHARGIAREIADVEQLDALLDRLTTPYDAAVFDSEGPQMPSEKRRAMLPAIFGFAIAVTELTGKFKLSQNRSTEDQQRVISRLGQSGDAQGEAVATLMLENLIRPRA
jgi:transcriptional regulator